MKQAEDTTIHLCDQCGSMGSTPECWPEEKGGLIFGDGNGNDNIIRCANYNGPAYEEVE